MKNLFLIIFFLSIVINQINSADLDLETIRADILKNHNYHRKRHQAEDLVRNTEIEKVAQAYSEQLATIDQMVHSGNQNYGENLFYCYASNKICVTGEAASQSWYDEVKDYNYSNPVFSSKTGHFTQLVWKDTEEIGCGAACNSNNKCYVTCNYYPPGNYRGEFEDNVLPVKNSANNNSPSYIIMTVIFALVISLV